MLGLPKWNRGSRSIYKWNKWVMWLILASMKDILKFKPCSIICKWIIWIRLKIMQSNKDTKILKAILKTQAILSFLDSQGEKMVSCYDRIVPRELENGPLIWSDFFEGEMEGALYTRFEGNEGLLSYLNARDSFQSHLQCCFPVECRRLL